MKPGVSQESKISSVAPLVPMLQHRAKPPKKTPFLSEVDQIFTSKNRPKRLFFVYSCVWRDKKVGNYDADKLFGPTEWYGCISLGIGILKKGGRKGGRPYWGKYREVDAKLSEKLSVQMDTNAIYDHNKGNQCSGNPPPFPPPFFEQIWGHLILWANL